MSRDPLAGYRSPENRPNASKADAEAAQANAAWERAYGAPPDARLPQAPVARQALSRQQEAALWCRECRALHKPGAPHVQSPLCGTCSRRHWINERCSGDQNNWRPCVCGHRHDPHDPCGDQNTPPASIDAGGCTVVESPPTSPPPPPPPAPIRSPRFFGHEHERQELELPADLDAPAVANDEHEMDNAEAIAAMAKTREYARPRPGFRRQT